MSSSHQDLIVADRQTRESTEWYQSFMKQQSRQEEIFLHVKPVFDAYEYYKNQYLLTQLRDELRPSRSSPTSSKSEPDDERARRMEIALEQKSKQIDSQQALLTDLQAQLSVKENEVKELNAKVSLVTAQSAQLQLQLNSTHKLLEEKLTEIIRLNDELRAAENVNKMELVEKIDRSEEASTVADCSDSSLVQNVPKRVARSVKIQDVDTCLNFVSANNSIVLVGSRRLHGLDLSSGDVKFEIDIPGSSGSSAVLCGAVSPDGDLGIMGTSESQLTVFDVGTKKISKDLKGHNGKIKACGFLGNRAKAFSVATDRTIKLWDLNRGGPIRSVPVVSQLVHGVSSTDGALIVTGHLNGKISLWTQSDKICELNAHTDSSLGVAISPDSRYVSSLGKDGSLCVFDVNMAHAGPLHTIRGLSQPTTESAPSFSPDSRMVAACTGPAVQIWDCISGKAVSQIQSDAHGVCWMYDKFTSRSTLITCHAPGVIKWWTP